MEKNTGPRFNAVLLLLYPTPGSTPGPPSELPYTTYASTFPNGAPPINMALLPAGNILDKLASNNTITSPIITYLQEEPGPWNEAYFSTERMVFVYTLVFINVFVGVREFIRFLWKKRSWDNWTRTHHIMFWLAVVSSILCTLTLILSPVSPTYIWIQTPLSILIGTAFHMFLICWCRVIARIENSRIVVAIYYILWPFYLFSVTMLIMHRIFSIMPYSPRSMIVFNISYYATSGMQVVWIVTFFYYIYIFWSKSRMGGINKATRKLLFQIVRVCSIFVTGIIVGLIANELIRGKIWRQSVASDTARSLLSQVSITIRTVAMILALDTDSDETKEKKRNIHIHRYNNNNNNNNNASPANANFVMLTSNLPNSPHSPHALKSSFVRISALMPERDDDDDIETHEV
ncbi:hypothetical protein BDF22DRAFT_9609 [Syncephalis plumigaleata]|nr:hypothetical protein BDF22DRAFT_9609 [Syncephalis plumigaleata]